jgi:3-methyl-2-oxobutanoate hydroxymethyltransferase
MSYPTAAAPAPTHKKAVTLARIAEMHAQGEKIAMLTCYDASFAALLERAGIDVMLVGDSLGNVLQGHASTLPVTLEQMAYHVACVARGSSSALIVADLPFGSYHPSPGQALASAAVLMQAGAHMVKLEGGTWLAETIQFLTARGMPVCAHLGFTPQSVHALGGFKVQGKSAEGAEQLRLDSAAVAAAGARMLVLEMVPSTLAAELTRTLPIPTIGIGAGPDCSGQVLVLHDILGIFPGRKARFVQNFMEGSASIEAAVANYIKAVREVSFPTAEHGFAST